MSPWKQLIDVAVWMAVDDSGEGAGQVSKRIDIVQLDEVDGSRFRRHSAEVVAMIAVREMSFMNEVTTVGLDLAKRVFQVHGADAKGRPVLQRKLRREEVLSFFAKLPPCVVGMEACASSHYWAREIRALGHDAKMIPASYVKPYVARQKERRCGRRSDLRSGDVTGGSARSRQVIGATGRAGGASHA